MTYSIYRGQFSSFLWTFLYKNWKHVFTENVSSKKFIKYMIWELNSKFRVFRQLRAKNACVSTFFNYTLHYARTAWPMDLKFRHNLAINNTEGLVEGIFYKTLLFEILEFQSITIYHYTLNISYFLYRGRHSRKLGRSILYLKH